MEVNEYVEEYLEIGDNFLDGLGDYELCTYKSDYIEQIDNPSVIENLKNNLAIYLNNDKRDFILTANIKTSIPNEQKIRGKYGIILHIPLLQDPGTGNPMLIDDPDNPDEKKINPEWKKWGVFNLDTLNMIGNPYNFTDQVIQKLKISIMKNCTFDETESPKIELFVEKFPNGNETEKPNDIFISDLSLVPIQYLTEEEKSGYILSLSCGSPYFLQNSSYTKTIVPKLLVNGKKTKIEGSYDCYQFKKDASIIQGSDGYNQLAGIGWRCLNEKTNISINEEDGIETFQYITNVYTLEVTKKEVKSDLDILCILVKDSKQLPSATITLHNPSSGIVCSLVSNKGSNSYIRNMGNIELTAKLYYPDEILEKDSIEVSQLRYDGEGNSLSTDIFETVNETLTEHEYELSIQYPVSFVESLNKIECTFSRNTIDYGLLNKEILGTASTIVTAEENPTYKVIIQNGDVLYKYDANGNSPFVADYAYPTSVEKTIKSLTYKIYTPEGTEFSDKDYLYCNATQTIPKDSLVKIKNASSSDNDYQYETGKGQVPLTYTIEDIQNPKKTNDTYIGLTVEFNGITLTDYANINFEKEGMLGVTGNKFTAVIEYKYGNESYGYGKRSSDGKIVKLQLCYSANTHKWYYSDAPGDSVQEVGNHNFKDDFSVKIYDNTGSPISIGIDPKWSIFDPTYTDPILKCPDNNTIIIDPDAQQDPNSEDDKYKDTSTVIRVEISLGDNGVIQDDLDPADSDNNKETIYAYYPVEVTYLGESISLENNFQIPHIADGYEEVLYCSDSTNPQYDSTNPFRIENTLENLNLNDEDSYNVEWRATANLNVPDSDKNKARCAIKPKTIFNSGEPKNTITAKFGIKESAISDIETREAQYKEERDALVEEKEQYSEENLQKIYGNEQTIQDSLKGLLNELAKNMNGENGVLKNSEIKRFLTIRKNILDSLNKILFYAKEVDKYIYSEFKVQTYYDQVAIPNVNSRRKDLWHLTKEGPLPAELFDLITLNFNDNDTFIQAFNLPAETMLNNIQKNSLFTLSNTLNYHYKIYNSYLNSIQSVNENRGYKPYKSKVIDDFKEVGIALDGDEFKNLIGFETLSIQYNAIICRLDNPLGSFSGTDVQEQNFLEENYKGKDPLISTVSEIKNLLIDIEKLFNRNNLNEDYYKEYYKNKSIYCDEQIAIKSKAIEECDKLIKYYNNIQVIITKPIMMVLNIYEFADLNGWDGSRLYIDENNQQYLYAPKVGAGIKEATDDGRTAFTGITMGVRGFANDSANHNVGLFGFSKGEQTYFLNARDGSTIMGKSGGGQIIIDPNAQIDGQQVGLLYSYNYQKPENYDDKDNKPINYTDNQSQPEGMLIDLSTPRIRFGSGNFEVNKQGHITAKGGGSIAGQTIGNTQLFKNNLYLDSGTEHPKTSSEEAYTSYGIYSGKHDKLTRINDGFYLSNDGLSIGNTIRITPGDNGKVLVGRVNGDNKQTISGDSSRAYIAFGGDTSQAVATEDGTSTAIAKVYIGTDGISLGKRFSVSSNGDLTAYSGTIGGQKLSKTELASTDEKVKITSSGSIEGNYIQDTSGQKIDSSGDAYFNSIYCKKVFEIGDSSVTGSNYQSSSSNAFNFGMGSYGSIANGGFSLVGNGTTYGATGLNMSPTTTKVGTSDLPTYVGDIAANKIDANVINTKIANADLTTTGTIKCGSLNITGGSSTVNGRLNMTGENGVIAFSDQKMDGSSVIITQGSNSYRVFLAKPVNS